MSETISVLYVDDDQMVREGIGMLIEKIEYVKVRTFYPTVFDR